jgi:hypothetical protein
LADADPGLALEVLKRTDSGKYSFTLSSNHFSENAFWNEKAFIRKMRRDWVGSYPEYLVVTVQIIF